MRYAALEEHFSIQELADQWPSAWGRGEIVFSRSFADVERRLPDFTEYRLAEMDATGIDIQVPRPRASRCHLDPVGRGFCASDWSMRWLATNACSIAHEDWR